jgi:acyl-CoA thioesterase
MDLDEDVKYATSVVAKDPMASFLGIQIEEVKRAYARLSLRINENYLNSLGRAHGMAISSLIDQTVAVACNATEHEALVVELKINFLDAVPLGGKIFAEALPLDVKRKLSLWQAEVKDSTGNKVAIAQALAYHRAKKLD